MLEYAYKHDVEDYKAYFLKLLYDKLKGSF